ncbi:hypothetical protein H2203_007285 [Taxawa tesnikishii (nom. ined.)]|nr:hypothetical protein H2203_007285 [Dothideales sp. JES 119]
MAPSKGKTTQAKAAKAKTVAKPPPKPKVTKPKTAVTSRAKTSQPTGGEDHLSTLPIELLDMIMANLGRDDVFSLRLACRQLADVGWRPYHSKLTSIYLHPNSKSIAAFDGIISHPVFSQNIREVVLSTVEAVTYVDALVRALTRLVNWSRISFATCIDREGLNAENLLTTVGYQRKVGLWSERRCQHAWSTNQARPSEYSKAMQAADGILRQLLSFLTKNKTHLQHLQLGEAPCHWIPYKVFQTSEYGSIARNLRGPYLALLTSLDLNMYQDSEFDNLLLWELLLHKACRLQRLKIVIERFRKIENIVEILLHSHTLPALRSVDVDIFRYDDQAAFKAADMLGFLERHRETLRIARFDGLRPNDMYHSAIDIREWKSIITYMWENLTLEEVTIVGPTYSENLRDFAEALGLQVHAGIGKSTNTEVFERNLWEYNFGHLAINGNREQSGMVADASSI